MDSTQTPIGRIPVRLLSPLVDGGRWTPKAYDGEVVTFEAEAFREGHDVIGVWCLLESPDGERIRLRAVSEGPGLDRFRATARLDGAGTWRVWFEAFADEGATWMRDAAVKIEAGVDGALMLQVGGLLLGRGARDRDRTEAGRAVLRRARERLRRATRLDPRDAFARVVTDEVREELEREPIAGLTAQTPHAPIRVEGRRAGVGAWYEFFPRSVGARRLKGGAWRSGTFRTAQQDLPRIARLGFDVVYLPPIHPIGRTNRKGRDNSLVAEPSDPGSPWAIGAPEGGHDAVHPDLGTLDDFRAFVRAARREGLEVALDLALQASPDHPWVVEHPEWFTQLPDGTIAYAENPPKKYQDIYPINFDRDPEGLYAEVVRIVEHWIAHGVRIFRVDNPHTKPTQFWQRLLGEMSERHPECVFLAEAFTRPAPMSALAKAGFQQSYTYFTWRNEAGELADYLSELSHDSPAYLRPNLFVNTPDILTDYLRDGGPAAFAVRAAAAAIGSPSWGMYSGFELFEHDQRPGSEEYSSNEKYEYRPRDFAAARASGASLEPMIARLNEIRRQNPALQQLRNLTVHGALDGRILVVSKHLDGDFTDDGVANTILLVANTEPWAEVESLVELDLGALGLPQDARFEVEELLTGQTWAWGRENYVRLGGSSQPVHVLRVQR